MHELEQGTVNNDVPDEDTVRESRVWIGVISLGMNMYISVINFFCIIYIILNFTETGCNSLNIEVIICVLQVFELLASFSVFCDLSNIWNLVHGKIMNTGHEEIAGRIIKKFYDTDECVDNLRTIFWIHVYLIFTESIFSFLLWSKLYPDNYHCRDYWFGTADNTIFYLNRMFCGWIGMLFGFLCIIYVGFFCLKGSLCCIKDFIHYICNVKSKNELEYFYYSE